MKYQLLVDINYMKFSQNEAERIFLLATGDLELAEASPYDSSAGISFSETTAEANRSKCGSNKLGRALIAVRTRIREELSADVGAYWGWDFDTKRVRLMEKYHAKPGCFSGSGDDGNLKLFKAHSVEYKRLLEVIRELVQRLRFSDDISHAKSQEGALTEVDSMQNIFAISDIDGGEKI